MSKHTPGPWLDWDTLEWLVQPKRLLEGTADARLIAAAPELLAALIECANDLEDEIKGQYDHGILEYPSIAADYERDMETVLRARALIAKIANDEQR